MMSTHRSFDASRMIEVTTPEGETRTLSAVPAEDVVGHYVAEFRTEVPEVYRVDATVVRGGASNSTARDWLLVGGANAEFADPRLNEEVLRRIATASGGRVVDVDDLSALPDLLRAGAPNLAPPVTRDLWHGLWSFVLVLVALTVEWDAQAGMGDEIGQVDRRHGGLDDMRSWFVRVLVGVAVLVPATASGENYYTLIVVWAAGGPPYVETFDRWRQTLVTALRSQEGLRDGHLIVLSETPGPGVGRASQAGVAQAVETLADRMTGRLGALDRAAGAWDVRRRGRQVQPRGARPRGIRMGCAPRHAPGANRRRQHDRCERGVRPAFGPDRAGRDQRHRVCGTAVRHDVPRVLREGARRGGRRYRQERPRVGLGGVRVHQCGGAALVSATGPAGDRTVDPQ